MCGSNCTPGPVPGDNIHRKATPEGKRNLKKRGQWASRAAGVDKPGLGTPAYSVNFAEAAENRPSQTHSICEGSRAWLRALQENENNWLQSGVENAPQSISIRLGCEHRENISVKQLDEAMHKKLTNKFKSA